MSSAVAPDPSRVTTPVDRGVIDLLGLLAYAELVSFFRLASDAELAPTLTDKAELAAFAATEQAHHQVLRRKLVELGVDPEEAMQPFIAPWTPGMPTPPRKPGWKAWSRRMWGTGSRPISTGRSPK